MSGIEERLARLERAHDGHQHGIGNDQGVTYDALGNAVFTAPPDQKVGAEAPDGYSDDDFARWHQEALERGFDHNHPRYFLRPHGTALWQEVDEGGYISAEHAAGFYPKDGLGVATGSFGTGAIDGKSVTPPVPPEPSRVPFEDGHAHGPITHGPHRGDDFGHRHENRAPATRAPATPLDRPSPTSFDDLIGRKPRPAPDIADLEADLVDARRDLATTAAGLQQAEAERAFLLDRVKALELALKTIKVLTSPNQRLDGRAAERAYGAASDALSPPEPDPRGSAGYQGDPAPRGA